MTTNANTKNDDNASPSRPQMIVTYPPERDTMFRMLAPSKTQLRSSIEAYQDKRLACSQCWKSGEAMQKCARCKSAWYCSKECQKNDWSKHKQLCRDVERGISKLIQTFLLIPALRLQLEVCLVLEFDLVNNKHVANKPLMTRVDIGIEPSEIPVFFDLFTGSANPEPEKIQGMLQINGITPSPPDLVPHQHRLKIWEETRNKLIAADGVSSPVIIVEFICNDSVGAFTSLIVITEAAFTIAKAKEPFIQVSAITGKSSIPLSVSSCMESMNTFIRSDKKNQLQLRRDMREEDRELIRKAGRKELTGGVPALLDKMSRERIYVFHAILKDGKHTTVSMLQ